MANILWDDVYYLDAYCLARDGLGDKNIAEGLGISTARFRQWSREKPVFAEAVRRGREVSGRTMREFIVGHIPEGVAPVWDAIVCKWSAAKKAAKKGSLAAVRSAELELLTNPLNEAAKQQLYFTALAANSWNPAKACRMIGLPAYVLSGWKKDPKFLKLFNLIHEAQQDFVEGQLMGLVEAANPAATIFASKSLLADRGYAEQRRHTHRHEVSGEVKQVVEHRIAIEELDLPVALMAQIMEHVDKREAAQRRIGVAAPIDVEFTAHE